MNNFPGEHLSLDEVRLWYVDTGGEGAAVVLCHPASQGCAIWSAQFHAFSEAGFRVIAYARRGYEHSETGPADNVGSSVGDLTGVLDRLGIDKAHILGAAAGGMTAAGFAVTCPQRVLSLVLAGTILAPDEPEWREMYQRLGLSEVHQAVPVEFLELGPSYRATNPQGTAEFVEAHRTAHPETRVSQPVGATVTWQSIGAMHAPTLLLTGEADLYAPPPLQAVFAPHFPNREVLTLPEVGHSPYWERPDLFNQLVIDFFSKHTPVQ